mmetsp:Transcript_10710/g.30124  ORF Transcript_10710/g.30124 Transcript_10710/m.30124 type:complete len:105 (-) Transcript_10710:303-617(-)
MAAPILGLSLDQSKPKLPIRVVGVVPGTLAAEYPSIRVGDELVAVSEQLVVGMNLDDVKLMIQNIMMGAQPIDHSKTLAGETKKTSLRRGTDCTRRPSSHRNLP